ncbi:MBL fold metallo-hydrolase [Bdellovibrio bacteriovorus]|uniref:MBL fold metallo-hydrolase n=1 Tax=Bdellovibrio bacteriovorus TaxID=959 RepID=UPI0021CE29F0|nr:MBL fold metallo-hydrolase [Bdellovibrio bacteriovorus]UXR65944.1 MBL fold metallo-hydrolase [Bdellovibrio bacteriovorus]
MKISRILHAGYLLESKGTQIAFDTIFETPFSRNCHAFPKVSFDQAQIRNLRLDAVFISHFHDDHWSMESLALLDRETPIYGFCVFEEFFSLTRKLGFKQVYSLKLNHPVQVGDFTVTPRRALDENVDSLFQIQAQGLNILNVVDSWIDYETLELLKQQAPWDLIMWPFQTMREIEVLSPSRAEPASGELPPEWIEQLKLLNPKSVIPSSCQFQMEDWSWYNKAFFPISYAQFQKQVCAVLPNTDIVRLDPSCSIEINKSRVIRSTPLSWMKRLEKNEVDYVYDPDLVVPNTAEVARRLGPNSQQMRSRVLKYCQSEIKDRYRSLEEPDGVYFGRPVVWQLSVFDDKGSPEQFRYVIQRNQITEVTDQEFSVGWTTEVPLVKLYAALELGESLTSMYVRINDTRFSEDIEKRLGSADFMEDPLVRCLFDGAFASYQKAQLKIRGTE